MMKNLSLLTLIVLFGACTESAKNGGREKPNGDRDNNNTNTPAIKGEFVDLQPSQISRTRGAEQKSYTQIRNELSQSILNENEYRSIPIAERDNTSEALKALTPTSECGLDDNLKTIKARINDCLKKNNGRHMWSGQENGIAGEGNWSLVANHQNPDYQIWIDERTGLVWSQTVDRAAWNKASGNASAASCGDLDLFTDSEITWRLPTRNDFLQADINGHAMVSLNTSDTDVFWTATSANNTDNAWAITLATGVLIEVDKKSLIDIKCVGEILK